MAQATEPLVSGYNHGAAHSYAENIKHSRTNFFVLLIAQLYCLITIETTQDAALLSNATTQKLPILETTIGIETFYIIAPLLLLIIFFHFQIHLKSFFSSMVQLARREGRDPVELVDTYPWFITSSMTRRYAAGSENESGFSSWFEYVAGLLFGWYSTAIVCFMFWARYLAVHDWTVTIYHSALTSLAIAGAVFFLFASKSGLRQQKLTGWRVLPRGFSILLAFLIPFSVLTYSTWWMFEAQDKAGCQAGSFAAQCDALFLLRDRLEFAGIDPAAALDGADLSERPEGWIPPAEPTYEQLLPVRGATLPGADLRYASARDALFVRADLSEAVLRRATFDGAALQGAVLTGADLSFSTFVAAKFDHAVLVGTTMDSVDLSKASFRHATFTRAITPDVFAKEANFSNADLEQCNFPRADFRETIWTDADMNGCQFEAATFDFAKLQNAKLEGSAFLDATTLAKADATGALFAGSVFVETEASEATFDAADFFSAKFTGGRFRGAKFTAATFSRATLAGTDMFSATLRDVDFRGAKLTDVDLRKADLRGSLFVDAVFENVKMADADIVGANFSGADLRTAEGLDQKQLDRACGDKNTRLPLGLRIKSCDAS